MMGRGKGASNEAATASVYKDLTIDHVLLLGEFKFGSGGYYFCQMSPEPLRHGLTSPNCVKPKVFHVLA
jgi:hypothetical protein